MVSTPWGHSRGVTGEQSDPVASFAPRARCFAPGHPTSSLFVFTPTPHARSSLSFSWCRFTGACEKVMPIFDHIGAVFYFAKSEMETKKRYVVMVLSSPVALVCSARLDLPAYR